MKKKILTFLIAFSLCAVMASGCGLGSTIENNKPKDPSASLGTGDNDPTDDPSAEAPEVKDNGYTVSVYYNNKLYDPVDSEVTVVWRGSTIVRVPLGRDGKANAGELEGDYNVYLEGLPAGYSYNPNETLATENARNVQILLMPITQPVQGDGGVNSKEQPWYTVNGCYLINREGTYRAEIKKEGQKLYYEFNPGTTTGYYTITSWVNIFEDEISPQATTFYGGSYYKYNEQPVNGGGAHITGGYTNNFYIEYRIAEAGGANTITFSVSAESKFNEYPVYVDFDVRWQSDYVPDYMDVRVVRAKEAKVKAAEKKDNETYVTANMGTKIYDLDNYKYNPDTGFYHRYDETLYADDPYGYGEGFGPILCCAITKSISYCYTAAGPTTLAGMDHAGNEGGSNYLRLSNSLVTDIDENGNEVQKYVTNDYTMFIQEDYGSKCNSDGVCYVTEELKQFLQKFAENYSLWTDGVIDLDGTPEAYGYFAKQDALWLFACGFYQSN